MLSAEAIERLMVTQNAEGAASRTCAKDHEYLRYTRSASRVAYGRDTCACQTLGSTSCTTRNTVRD